MATPSINQASLGDMIAMEGKLQSAKGYMLEETSRPGVAGHAFDRRGRKGERSLILTHTGLDSAANARAKYEAYVALKGTLATVIDADGETHNSVAVIHVSLVDVVPVGTATQSGVTHVLVCRWELQKTETT
jgi:hypothetical protein